jgi:hypothetical protein
MPRSDFPKQLGLRLVSGGGKDSRSENASCTLKASCVLEMFGAGGETRTHDLGIMRPSLYP